jgi:hypothetical protein
MRIETHLTSKSLEADFAIDLSNVMKMRGACGDRTVDLARFGAVIEGLIAFAKDESIQVCAVADWSLLRSRDLTEGERATLKRWFRRGLIEVLEVADDRLLELADATGQRVVSADNFLDYYRTYPWIAANRDQFLQPCIGTDGLAISVLPRIMPVPPESAISRKEEQGLLLAAGMFDRRGGSGARRELLTRLWRCPEDDCPLFGVQRQADQPLPVYRSDVVRCPTHRHPLTDVGPSQRRIQVKVRVGGTVRHRFLVTAGSEVAVGRQPDGDGVALLSWLDSASESWISRSHVVLSFDGSVLSVRDTSTNGTWIRRASGERVRVKPASRWRMRKGDEISLDTNVHLITSGREFIFVEPESVVDVAPPAEPAAPTAIRRRPSDVG